MSLLASEQIEDLIDLQGAVNDLGSDLVVIGALAFRAFFRHDERHTEDIDVAVALDLDGHRLLGRALCSSGWKQHPKQEQRWGGPNNSRIDILPAGPDLREAGQLTWPQSTMVMSLLGFDHAFRHAIELEVAAGLRIKVVPPVVLFLLKVVSYLDDRQRRAKDLRDVHAILRHYEVGSDRLYSATVLEAGLPDMEFAPAFLLGIDLAALCRPHERQLIDRFVEMFVDPTDGAFCLLLRFEGPVEPIKDRLCQRLRALRDGLGRGSAGA